MKMLHIISIKESKPVTELCKSDRELNIQWFVLEEI